MHTITFPLLNLKLEIPKIAFTIGGIDVYWYAIFIIFAFILSLIIFKIKDGKFNIKFSDILDLSIYVIPISILSARLYYVIFNAKYYFLDPIQIFNFRNGGLAIYGGIIGGVITCYVFCKKRKINLLDLLDFIVPSLALRTIHWKMGQFCESRSIWRNYKCTMENGHISGGGIYRSTSYISI